MSVLLSEIRRVSPDAAAALQKTGFVSDTDIRSLTRQDLNELIPGAQHLRQRQTIGDLIQNVKPINAVLRELLDFIPDDCVKAALKNGVLNDYLVILRDMKTKVESVHSFHEAHIGLYAEKQDKELYPFMQTNQQPASLSVDCAPVERHSYGQTDDHCQGSVAADSTVRVKVIVKGQTFGCHRTLLQRVRQLDGLHVDETDSSPNVIIVFFPVKTMPHKPDIKAAMKDVVPGEAAAILVVMHHTHDVDYRNIVRSRGADRTWDFVNVLYHETVPGLLLTCALNEQAVAQLCYTLLEHSSGVVSPVAAAASAHGGGSSGKTKGGSWWRL